MSRKSIALALLLQVAALPVLSAQELYASSNVGVDVNIHLGNQPRPVVVAPPPAVVTQTPYYDEIEEEVEFIYPEPLGFYVAVGVPYDLFFYNNSYYMFRDGRWLRSYSSRGRWIPVGYRQLPPPMRRHRIDRIREYRTREYVIYQRDRDHYRGRHRSDKGYWKAAHREEKRYDKERRHEEKRYDKERRHEEKRHDKERRHEEKRHDREERRGRD
uniref:Uncharacterized protein n=1 Tax=Geobacter sp. (strain M21) TaxID=443144 RepID=C6E3D1_GEOSM